MLRCGTVRGPDETVGGTGPAGQSAAGRCGASPMYTSITAVPEDPPPSASCALDTSDLTFMSRAVELAREAEAAGEVPVGAIIVKDGTIVAEGSNRPISANDPTAHAEMVALRAAGQALGSYRLTGTTLYVTLEPCAMCASAMVHARVERLVYAATDPRAGAAGSVFNIVQHPALNHRLECTGGVLAEECGAMLRSFFLARR